MTLRDKYEELKTYLKAAESVAVAFSGGADSAFLLKAAQDALGEKAAAITVQSSLIPESEIKDAQRFCKDNNIHHIVCQANPLSLKAFTDNPPDRCYICKKEIFTIIKNTAEENGIKTVAEGSNSDDNNDYRPGIKAIRELSVISPLQIMNFTKNEIREMSEILGLPTYNKPSFACLASRFAYGESITDEKLKRVEKAEEVLREAGFKQFRVRVHGDIARIEILSAQFEKLLKQRGQIYKKFKSFGFSYVTMDLQGYRTGSMNEVLQNID